MFGVWIRDLDFAFLREGCGGEKDGVAHQGGGAGGGGTMVQRGDHLRQRRPSGTARWLGSPYPP